MVASRTSVTSIAQRTAPAGQETRDRLLDAAIHLIWEQSYGSVGVNDICDRARVNKGSFYHFFDSKSDLAAAAFERHWQNSLPKLERVFAADVPPLQRLDRYCTMVYEVQRERRKLAGKVFGCPFAAMGSEVGTQDERLRQTSRDILAARVRYFEEALRDAAAAGEIPAQPFHAVAQSMSALVSGVLLQARIENDLAPIRVLLPSMFDLIRRFAPGAADALREAPRRTRQSRGTA